MKDENSKRKLSDILCSLGRVAAQVFSNLALFSAALAAVFFFGAVFGVAAIITGVKFYDWKYDKEQTNQTNELNDVGVLRADGFIDLAPTQGTPKHDVNGRLFYTHAPAVQNVHEQSATYNE